MCDTKILEQQIKNLEINIESFGIQIRDHVKDSQDPIKKITELYTKMDMVTNDLYGNGQPGIVVSVAHIRTLLEQYVEEERDKGRISKTGQWIMVSGVFSSLIVGTIAILLNFI